MRAVVVLLLLIANAIVASRNDNPAESAPSERTDSLALLSTVDGAAPEHGRRGCATDGRLACRIYTQAGETPTCRTGEDARAPIFTL